MGEVTAATVSEVVLLEPHFHLLTFAGPPLEEISLHIPRYDNIACTFLHDRTYRTALPVTNPQDIEIRNSHIKHLVIIGLYACISIRPYQLGPTVRPGIRTRIHRQTYFIHLRSPTDVVNQTDQIFSIGSRKQRIRDISRVFQGSSCRYSPYKHSLYRNPTACNRYTDSLTKNPS